MTNVNAYMNQYAAGQKGRVDEGHPLYIAGYSAGIKQGRELEREQLAQKRARMLSVNVSVTDMDIFNNLLDVTKRLFDLADHEEQDRTIKALNELIGATHDISDFNNREERRE